MPKKIRLRCSAPGCDWTTAELPESKYSDMVKEQAMHTQSCHSDKPPPYEDACRSNTGPSEFAHASNGPSSKIMHGCPHCKREFIRSCLLEDVKKNDKEIKLICTACEKDYKVENTEKQLELMKCEFGKPSVTEAIFSISHVGLGDIFKLNESDANCCIVVILQVDRNEEKVRVSKLRDSGSKKLDCDQWFSVDDLRSQKATLYRFKPMDCLPRPETLRRATDPTLVANEKSSAEEKFKYFGNWCKTGNFKSLEQKEFSLIGTLWTIIRHPKKSLDEFRKIGTGFDMSEGNEASTGSGWNDKGEGWSSSKVGGRESHEAAADSTKSELLDGSSQGATAFPNKGKQK